MKDKYNISFHGSHNGGVVVEKNGEILVVLEFERFFNIKNMGIAQYKTHRYPTNMFFEVLNWIEKKYGVNEYENCYFSSADFVGELKSENPEQKEIRYNNFYLTKYVNAKNIIHGTHHESHANGCFYQSPYQKSLIFSFDGGGDDGEFNVYIGDKDEGVTLLERVINPTINHHQIYYNLGFAYMIFANYCIDISPDDLGNGNLVWPGKIMGLSPYGNVIEEWLEPFIEFYKSDPDGGNNDYINKLKILSEKTGLIFDVNNKLSGQTEYDMAATSQKAFEECFLEVAKPYFEKYPNLPICMAGGCSLNIILNTRIKFEFNKEVFVGPNPNDCGIAVGNMLKHMKPKTPIDLTYAGLPILDEEVLCEYLSHHTFLHGVYHHKKIMNYDSNYHFTEQIEFNDVIDDIINGKIVGVVQGNSEHGPRALGNRSIICNPMIPEMKDILNFKVKNREWFRPFAPIVRLEDISEYFIFNGESRWMSFSPKVKPEWREKLPSITHVDGTARVQTITKEQNKLLYDIITLIKEKTGVGVLLNTSFNVNGKPILSTYKDAFEIFHTTKLDSLIIKDLYIHK